MTALEFLALCVEHNIEPAIALENDAIIEALKAKNDEQVTLYFDGPNGDYPEDNVRIYGSPWQPEFYDWAFNLPRNGEELKSIPVSSFSLTPIQKY